MNNIYYKLGGSFEDVGLDGISIGFEILFPKKYSSYEEAKQNVDNIAANMEKQNDGSVIIKLYEGNNLADTIRWDEWIKYKCYRIKEECKDAGFVDANTDYQPCSEKFEGIFKNYVTNRDISSWSMQYLAYWIEPVIVTYEGYHI